MMRETAVSTEEFYDVDPELIAIEEPDNPWIALVPELPDEPPVEAEIAPQVAIAIESRTVSERLLDAFFTIANLAPAVDGGALLRFFEQATPHAIELSPVSEREEFRARLAALTPQRLEQVAAPESEVAVAPAFRNAEEKRLALILSRISQRSEARDPLGDDDAAFAAAVMLICDLASTRQELNDQLRRLLGVPDAKLVSKVFRILSRSISSWDLAALIDESSTEAPEALRAMLKIITLSKDVNDRAANFRELVMAAVDRLNHGAFAAACAMLDLSVKVLHEGDLHATIVDRIRTDALREIEGGTLRAHLQDSSRHPLLRKALGFFPRLKHGELIERLHDERHDERRELLRSLIEVWGADARQALLEQLEREIAHSEADHDYVRVLFGLIERIPRGTESDVRFEIEVLGRASAPGQPVAIITQAVAAIGGIRFETAGRLLSRRLAEFEALPFRTDKSYYQPEEIDILLDATIAALARLGTPIALRAIVRHGLGQSGSLGDVRARLRSLSTVDLSSDLDALAMLWKQIRAELPMKFIKAVASTRPNHNPTQLIEALRATRAESARKLLKEIAAEYPQTDFGRAAANILREQSRRAAEPPPKESRSGELSYFDFPRIVQSLIDTNATGLLSLADGSQVIHARLWFNRGVLIRVENDGLHGAAAVYQLLERPVIGSYAFTQRQIQNEDANASKLDFMRLLREGARRHDEYRKVMALVPDDAVFEATTTRPSRHPEESDPILLRGVWVGATSGQPTAAWEKNLAVDSWRVRRIIARWVEEDSLQVRGTAN